MIGDVLTPTPRWEQPTDTPLLTSVCFEWQEGMVKGWHALPPEQQRAARFRPAPRYGLALR